jgi:hypothetical protein
MSRAACKSIAACIGLALIATDTWAQDVPQAAAAVQIIRDTAKDICPDVPTEGGNTKVAVAADANAKLDGAISKLANLGVGAAAKYQSEKYKGVPQSDLANAIKDTGNCRLAVLKTLDKIVPGVVSGGVTSGGILNPSALPDGVYGRHQKNDVASGSNCYFRDSNKWLVKAELGELTLNVVTGHFGNGGCVNEYFKCESRLLMVPSVSSPGPQSTDLQFYTEAAKEDEDRTGLFIAEAQSASGKRETNTSDLIARCAGSGKVPLVGFKGRLTGKSATELTLKGGDPGTDIVLTKESEARR